MGLKDHVKLGGAGEGESPEQVHLVVHVPHAEAPVYHHIRLSRVHNRGCSADVPVSVPAHPHRCCRVCETSLRRSTPHVRRYPLVAVGTTVMSRRLSSEAITAVSPVVNASADMRTVGRRSCSAHVKNQDVVVDNPARTARGGWDTGDLNAKLSRSLQLCSVTQG